MKRFTETEKWRDPWFRRLSPAMKLGYLYLLDTVDNAGVCDLDPDLANFQVGCVVEWDQLAQEMGDRLQELNNGKWHLRKFTAFQFGELQPECRPHQQVIRLIKAHGIGYPYPMDTLQDKDKDKDKDKEQARVAATKPKPQHEEQSELPIDPIPENLSTPAFLDAWSRWQAIRRAGKKPKTPWPLFFAAQLKWLAKFTPAEAVEVIEASIRNGWQGLFEPKQTNGKPNASHQPNSRSFQQRQSYSDLGI